METNLKILGVFLAYLSLQAACASSLQIPADQNLSPQVVTVSPTNESIAQQLDEVRIQFDRPIDPDTVGESSVQIIRTADTGNPVSNLRMVTKPLQGQYEIAEHKDAVIWHPATALQMGQYQVQLTPTLTAPGFYPVHCTIQNGACIISRFIVLGSQTSTTADANMSASGALGNPSSTTVDSATSSTSSSVPISAVINEIYYDDPVSDSDGTSFVELKGNPGSDLSGCVLRFVNGADGKKVADIVLTQGTKIKSNGLFVVADTKTRSNDSTQVSYFDYLANFDPQDGPDSVQLLSAGGQILDVVGYGTGIVATDVDGYPMMESEPAADAPAGKSLSRIHGQDTGVNAKDFVVNDIPSPGSEDVSSQAVSSYASTSVSQSSPIVDANDSGSTVDISKTSSSSDTPETSDSSKSSDLIDPAVTNKLPLVIIDEVVTDPQRDWNDTTGGNGKSFDVTPGTGTIGTTDEWVELVNKSDVSVNLSGWRLETLDGTDETDLLGKSAATLDFGQGGSLQNFQPNEHLVIGNPTGDMKNQSTLKLYNELSELIDEVEIDDGNANSADDEAVIVSDDGTISHGKATPGI